MSDKLTTASKPEDNIGVPAAPPRHSEFRRITRIFFGRKLYAIGFAIVVLLILVAIFAPWISPYDPLQTDGPNKLLQPSWHHLLGTDAVGRDTFSRIVYGARTSMIIGFTAVFAGSVVGTLMGLAAAYFGGWVFTVIMRFTDALMALPGIILVLLIAGLLRGGGEATSYAIVIFALGFGGIAGQCRMMCGQALHVTQTDYILAVRSLGSGAWRIILRHIFPNAFPPIMVGITMAIGGVVMGEAGLSYLGIGIVPPTPSWGGMVSNGQSYLLTNPILSLAPGVAIMLLVFGFNMVGDGLRDALDPKLRGIL